MPLAAAPLAAVLLLLVSGQQVTIAAAAAAAAETLGVASAIQTIRDERTSCVRTRVEGDAAFCVSETPCSGSSEVAPSGWACPRAGSVAVGDCRSSMQSYDRRAGECVAPADAVCRLAPSGTWACAWSGGTGAAAAARSRRRLVSEASSSMDGASDSASASASSSNSSSRSESDALALDVLAAGLGAAIVAVLAVVAVKMKKPRPVMPTVHVELEEVAISPGKPALVQTPSSTKLFVYTAQI